MLPVAAALGVIRGASGAWSAAGGVALVVANFAVHGLSLAWAAGISVSAVHAVALGGFALRMLVIVGAMFGLRGVDGFDAIAFGIAVAASTIALLVYEARLVLASRDSGLELPPDPVAVEAGRRLREREAALR